MLAPALALLLVTISEASIGIFVKLVDGQVPILTLNFYRVAFASIFLLVAVGYWRRGQLQFPRKNLRDIAIIGALIATQISLFNYAMTLTTVANAVIFWSIAPFFVFIFSSLFLGEKPRLSYFFIFLLAFLGIVIAEPVSLDWAQWNPEQIGNAVALATGVVYAALVTYLRSEGKTETQVDIFWFMTAATLYLSPALLWFGTGDVWAESSASFLGVSVPVLVWVLGLGVFSTGVAYFCISYVLQHIDANIYSLIDIIVSPLVAALLAAIIFAEVPSTNTIIGGVILLVSGALLTALRQGRTLSIDGVLPGSR